MMTKLIAHPPAVTRQGPYLDFPILSCLVVNDGSSDDTE